MAKKSIIDMSLIHKKELVINKLHDLLDRQIEDTKNRLRAS